jgi:protein SCO1/2
MSKNYSAMQLAAFTCLLVFAAGVGFYFSRQEALNRPPDIEGLLWPEPKKVAPFTALDHTGATFNQDRLLNKWSFVFFGYTHCPDVCPITLAVLKQVYEDLQQTGSAADVQVVFVTVDPERDTPEQLHDYVTYFNSDFTGVGGTPGQIAQLTGDIGIVSIRGEENTPGNYLVDHTASVLLLDPEGRLISIYSAPHDPVSILDRFAKIRRFLTD